MNIYNSNVDIFLKYAIRPEPYADSNLFTRIILLYKRWTYLLTGLTLRISCCRCVFLFVVFRVCALVIYVFRRAFCSPGRPRAALI